MNLFSCTGPVVDTTITNVVFSALGGMEVPDGKAIRPKHSIVDSMSVAACYESSQEIMRNIRIHLCWCSYMCSGLNLQLPTCLVHTELPAKCVNLQSYRCPVVGRRFDGLLCVDSAHPVWLLPSITIVCLWVGLCK